MTDNLGISNLYENDISEVAQSIRKFLDEVIQKDKLVLPTLKMSRHAIKGLSEIILTGSGQSFHPPKGIHAISSHGFSAGICARTASFALPSKFSNP